jgi:hypothetical protein
MVEGSTLAVEAGALPPVTLPLQKVAEEVVNIGHRAPKWALRVPGALARSQGVRTKTGVSNLGHTTGHVLATYLDNPILVDYGRHMVATFHPELTEDTRVHKAFLAKIA